MKRTAFAFTLLLLLAAVSLWHIHSVTQLTRDMKDEILRARQECLAGNYCQAELALRQSRRLWSEKERYLRIFFDHDKLDSISEGFFSAASLLKEENTPQMICALERLSEQLTQLCQDEQLRPDSVF